MAIITVEGILRLPYNTPSKNTKIRFTKATNEEPVLVHAPETFTTGSDGSYSFSLHTGDYYIDGIFDDQWQCIGYVEIPESTLSPATLGEILEFFEKPIPGNEEPTDPTDPTEPPDTEWPDARLDNLAEQVQENTDNIADLDIQQKSLITQVGVNTADIEEINLKLPEIDDNAAAIAANTALINTNTGNISGLQDGIDDNASDIATMKSDILGNTNDITNLETYIPIIDANTANIVTNANKIATNTSDISANETAIALNSADIATNASDILTNTNAIAAHDVSITENTNNIATNTADILQNTGDIAINVQGLVDNNTRDDTQDGRLDTIESKNAEQDSRLDGLEGRATLVGTFDALTNTYTEIDGTTHGDLPAATSVNTGDYIIVSVTGTISSVNAPELHGIYVSAQDQFLAGEAAWLHTPVPTNYLSSQVDDAAEGHIDFNVGLSSFLVPLEDEHVIRKVEHDVIVTQVSSLDTKVTGLSNDVDAVEASQGLQDTKINDNFLAIEGVDNRLTTAEEDIIENAGSIGINNTAIQTNVTNIGTNTTAISNIQDEQVTQNDRLDALELVEPTSFAHNYVLNNFVAYNTFVAGDGWLTICNNPAGSTANAYPVNEGLPSFVAPEVPPWTSGTHLGQIKMGQVYNFTKSGWLSNIRVKVNGLTDDHHHYVMIRDITNPDDIDVTYMEIFPSTASGWSNAINQDMLVPAGSVLEVTYIHDVSSESTLVTGGWTYVDTGNNLPTLTAGQWSVDNGDDVAIHITDLDSTSRQTELMGMTAGTSLRMAETGNLSAFTEWTVIAEPSLNGSQVQYLCIESIVGNTLTDAATCTLTATIPTPLETEYEEVVDYWVANQPAWGSVSGMLELSGTGQAAGNNLYPIDIQFQQLNVSTDFTIVSAKERGINNPVNEAPPAELSVIAASSVTALATVTDDSLTFAVAQIEGMQYLKGYQGQWIYDSTKAEFTYFGRLQAFEVEVAGRIVTSVTGSGMATYGRLIKNGSEVLTGSTQGYLAGELDVGVSNKGIERFGNGDTLSLEIAKNYPEEFYLKELIVALKPI